MENSPQKNIASFGIAPDCDHKVSTWRGWRAVHTAGPMCTAPLSATSAVSYEEVPHQGLPDYEDCCGPRGQSASGKRAEGNDSADLGEQGNQKLLVRCLIVMEACSMVEPF